MAKAKRRMMKVQILRAILADGRIYRPVGGKPLEAVISEDEVLAHGPKSVKVLGPAEPEPAADGPEKPAEH